MPFKESCMPFLDAIDPSARVIDSVNTIVNDNGRLTGLNTDYIAVKSLIDSHQLDTHASVMIQGSGGMGKAVIAAFRDAGFRDVVIAARNRDSGLALAKQYGFQWQPQPEGIRADILVNVTPLGMAGGTQSDTLAFSQSMVGQAQVVFDVVALPSETPLIRLAQKLDKQIISGAGDCAAGGGTIRALYRRPSGCRSRQRGGGICAGGVSLSAREGALSRFPTPVPYALPSVNRSPLLTRHRSKRPDDAPPPCNIVSHISEPAGKRW
jgi:hypothetical protein